MRNLLTDILTPVTADSFMDSIANNAKGSYIDLPLDDLKILTSYVVFSMENITNTCSYALEN